VGHIRLHTPLRGLMPGMTAEVEIKTEHTSGSLVVPSEAVVEEEGREFCYVARASGLERREVHLGQGTQALTEVTSGLAEGEEVVLDPNKHDITTGASPPAEPSEPVNH